MSATGIDDKSCCTKIKFEENDAIIALIDYQDNPSPPRRSDVASFSNPPTKSDGPLNYSSNILLVYRLAEMRHMENVNFTLAIFCLIYCGINVALIVINYVNSHNKDSPPVSDKS